MEYLFCYTIFEQSHIMYFGSISNSKKRNWFWAGRILSNENIHICQSRYNGKTDNNKYNNHYFRMALRKDWVNSNIHSYIASFHSAKGD